VPGAYFVVDGCDLYERSLGLNVNLGWGLVLLAFGGVMLWLGRRARPGARP